MRIILLIFIAFTIAFGTRAQSTNDFPKEVNAVFDYMINKDFPELFNEKPFQFRPIRWVIIDIDNDGLTEVFLQTYPHYRQSPTITIYQVDKQDSVKRITEAFAPGHLIEVSPEHDYFDTHTTGTAVDMQLGSSDPEKLRVFAKSSLKFGMSPILFKNFIHTDKRDGNPTFLDLTYLDDYPTENSCANFQFSFPDNIVAGQIEGKEYKYLIAQVKDELYCYEIVGFDENGWVKKQITVIDLPKDFKEFQVVEEMVNYVSKKGKVKSLKL